MKKTLIIIELTAVMGLTLSAQPNTAIRPDQTVLLYSAEFPEGADPVRAKEITSAGFQMIESNEITKPETITQSGSLYNVADYARIDLYFPAEPNGQMVLLLPGGGYGYLSSYTEGIYGAEWCVEHGITAAVLKYRLPNYGHHTVPLEDVHNTMRYCRSHAQEWGVTQIGILGCSAGGHLAVTASVMYVDEITKPDFSVFIFPVVTFDNAYTHKGSCEKLIGKESVALDRSGKSLEEWEKSKYDYYSLKEKYSLENQITSDNAPSFICLCSDDSTVNPQNSLILYSALNRNKVPVEMHIYPTGGHGWGFYSDRYAGEGKDKIGPVRENFSAELSRWLESMRTTGK